MLKRIKIQGFKSLADVEVNLDPLAVLIGPNASGKSNFLDALQLLSRITTCRTLKEAFDLPYRGYPLESFTFGPEGIKNLLERETVAFTLEVDVQLSPRTVETVNQRIQERVRSKSVSKRFVREQHLRYRIEIEMLPKFGILQVADEYLAALNTKGEVTRKRKPFLEQVEGRLRLRMEGQAHPLYYERHLDYSILSMSHYPPHYPHVVAMQEELSNWFTYYFEPRERMRLPNPVKEVDHVGVMGEDLAAFLNTLRALNEPQFKAVEKSLHAIIPSITGIDVSVNKLGQVELDLREGEKFVSTRIVSEGTLRILGLLALSGAKKQPVLVGFEEPENGIHPRRIRRIAGLLETRRILQDTQFIVTTHSPILPDLVPIDSVYLCRKVNGTTEIEPFTKTHVGQFWKKSEIQTALDAEDDLAISGRIVRGDFDA